MQTIGDILEVLSRGSDAYRLERFHSLAEWWASFAAWPPNVFALTSILLGQSGAYRLVVSPPPLSNWRPCADRPGWLAEVQKLANDWSARLENSSRGNAAQPPEAVLVLGYELTQAAPRLVRDLHRCQDSASASLCQLLLLLHAAADNACAGFGLTEQPITPLRMQANELLMDTGSLALLSNSIVRVLPKFRTPQVGITLRSLSHYLTIDHSEVDVRFLANAELCADPARGLNLLIVPWPFEIKKEDFYEVTPRWDQLNHPFSGFDFAPQGLPSVAATVRAALAEVDSRGSAVDGIVLPEAAVTFAEMKEIQEVLAERAPPPFLLTGVRGPYLNEAVLAIYRREARRWLVYRQSKHHRWCIDRFQIDQYGLGLPRDDRRYWEHIDVPPRQMHFTVGARGVTLCHLVCEDLARVDPVAELIRAVGPTLVIALLLDGPQLQHRWPARYSSVLADDPGSSVLSVTCLGMAHRYQAPGRPPSRVIGLWKDVKMGFRELELGDHAQGLLLKLRAETREEFTADGRSDGAAAAVLIYDGHEDVRTPSCSFCGRHRGLCPLCGRTSV